MNKPLAIAFLEAAMVHSRNGGEFAGPDYEEQDEMHSGFDWQPSRIELAAHRRAMSLQRRRGQLAEDDAL